MLGTCLYVCATSLTARWSSNPTTVNAYYSQTDNKMVFPAAIFAPPFYSSKFAQ